VSNFLISLLERAHGQVINEVVPRLPSRYETEEQSLSVSLNEESASPVAKPLVACEYEPKTSIPRQAKPVSQADDPHVPPVPGNLWPESEGYKREIVPRVSVEAQEHKLRHNDSEVTISLGSLGTDDEADLQMVAARDEPVSQPDTQQKTEITRPTRLAKEHGPVKARTDQYPSDDNFKREPVKREPGRKLNAGASSADARADVHTVAMVSDLQTQTGYDAKRKHLHAANPEPESSTAERTGIGTSKTVIVPQTNSIVEGQEHDVRRNPTSGRADTLRALLPLAESDEITPAFPARIDLDKLLRRERIDPPSAPTINVTIGRVEVRAITAPRPAERVSAGPKPMSLNEYLNQGNKRGSR
jgi:hypothetical protein